MRRYFLVLAVNLLLSGCFLGPDETLRTYPQVLDAELVSLSDLRFSVAAPDTYNVRVYVHAVESCPPNADCRWMHWLTLAEHPNILTEEAKFELGVEEPEQFTVRARYLMSIAVTETGDIIEGDAEVRPRYELIGYTLLNR